MVVCFFHFHNKTCAISLFEFFLFSIIYDLQKFILWYLPIFFFFRITCTGILMIFWKMILFLFELVPKHWNTCFDCIFAIESLKSFHMIFLDLLYQDYFVHETSILKLFVVLSFCLVVCGIVYMVCVDIMFKHKLQIVFFSTWVEEYLVYQSLYIRQLCARHVKFIKWVLKFDFFNLV